MGESECVVKFGNMLILVEGETHKRYARQSPYFKNHVENIALQTTKGLITAFLQFCDTKPHLRLFGFCVQGEQDDNKATTDYNPNEMLRYS